MWTRKQLKEKAKFALNHNYWKIVLVALILVTLAGGTSYTASYDLSDQLDTLMEEDGSTDSYFDDEYYDDYEYDYEYEYNYDSFDDYDYYEEEDDSLDAADTFGVAIVIVVVLLIVYIVVIAIYLVYAALIYNPVDIGAKRFFFKTLNQKAEVKEVAFAFDNNYKNVAKIMFFRDLYTILWMFLFIIPGIVKSYEYLMIPYLLAENPNLTKEQAFAMSKQMMTGHKWEAFVLNLSFLGWDILAACTLGILGVFYVQPYKNLTFAALYEELSLMNGRPALAMQQPNMANPYQQVNPYAQPEPSTEPVVTTEENLENNNTEE